MTTFPPFARRRNPDSSIDSICARCFRTVASTTGSEEELDADEKSHVCDPYWAFCDTYFNRNTGSYEVRQTIGQYSSKLD